MKGHNYGLCRTCGKVHVHSESKIRDIATKVCTKCKIEKPIDQFGKTKRTTSGLSYHCKSCRQEYDRKYQNNKYHTNEKYRNKRIKAAYKHREKCKTDPVFVKRLKDRNRNCRLKHDYGITLDQYNIMLNEQGHKCAICGATNPGRKGHTAFYVDHDHKTGKVRGLLCYKCNIMIGVAGDSPIILNFGMLYLERYK